MDRAITNRERKKFADVFDPLDIFPYSIALVMIAAEIYILHQFATLTPQLFY